MSTEDALLSFLENLAFIDFGFILQVIFGMFAALWGFTVLWVWSDSGERTTSVFFRLIVTLFVYGPTTMRSLFSNLMFEDPSPFVKNLYTSTEFISLLFL